MSWEPVGLASRASAAVAPVTLSLLKAGGRYVRVFRLMVRVDEIDQPPSFLKPGARIGVMRGVGEHAGMIRLVPNGMHLVKRMSRQKNSALVLVTFPPPPGLPPEAVSAMPVEFDYAEAWFDIILPAWARPPAVAPVKALTGASQIKLPPKNASNPFVVPDQLRRGAKEAV